MTQVEPYAFRVDSLLRELRVLLIKETGNSVSNRLTPKTLVAVTSTYLFHSRSTRSLAAFAPADTPEEAVEAVARIGAPALMKTRREGYDGKGQRWVEHAADAARIFAELGSVPVIVEAPAEFVRELSVIAARGSLRRYVISSGKNARCVSGIACTSLGSESTAERGTRARSNVRRARASHVSAGLGHGCCSCTAASGLF